MLWNALWFPRFYQLLSVVINYYSNFCLFINFGMISLEVAILCSFLSLSDRTAYLLSYYFLVKDWYAFKNCLWRSKLVQKIQKFVQNVQNLVQDTQNLFKRYKNVFKTRKTCSLFTVSSSINNTRAS